MVFRQYNLTSTSLLFPETNVIRFLWHFLFWLLFIITHLVFFLPVIIQGNFSNEMLISYILYYAKFAPIFYSGCYCFRFLQRYSSALALWIMLLISGLVLTHIFSVICFVIANRWIGLANCTPSFHMLGEIFLNPTKDYKMWLTLMVFNFQDMQLLFLPIGIKVFKYGLLYQKARQALQIQRERAELYNLKSQLEPHFIINVINSAYLKILPIQQEAAEYLSRLADIIRFALNDANQDMISLEKELACFKNLVALESTRRRFRLDLSIRETGQIKSSHCIPALLLLTLGENAFKHGLKNVRATNILNITINISNDQLEFNIENTKTENTDNKPNPNSGIGLQNIIQRLTLHFKDDFTFFIENLPDLYRVHLVIPIGDKYPLKGVS